jgi:hypothetical protein
VDSEKVGQLLIIVAMNKMSLNEICSKVHINKHLSNAFRIQNGLKKGDTFSLLL